MRCSLWFGGHGQVWVILDEFLGCIHSNNIIEAKQFEPTLNIEEASQSTKRDIKAATSWRLCRS